MLRPSLMFLALFALLTGCSSTRQLVLTEERFPPTPPDQEIRLYVNEVQRPHIELAHVQSFVDRRQDNETKREQLESLRKQSRKLGADAIVNVRQMSNKVRGMVLDEAVPFRSYRQGLYDLYFLRGTAIKFLDEADSDDGWWEEPAAEPAEPVEDVPEAEEQLL